MDSQEAANNPARGPNVVKPSAPLPSGFQARPQAPPAVLRHPPPNNGPVGGPRPGGQPPAQFRRLDSRSSLAQPGSGQFVQLRPYGPPRPPGAPFPQRPAQPGQSHPQNSAVVLNPRFIQPSGLRGPGPQQVPRPTYPPNYQPQQPPRNNAPRIIQGGPEYGQNGPWQNPAGPESAVQRPFQRNESSLNVHRQRPPSNEEEQRQQQQQQQQTRPRIVVDRMSDIERLRTESSPLRRKAEIRENGENEDDDDDVVMDGAGTPRANGSAGSEREDVVVGSGAVNGAKRNEDVVDGAAERPGTGTIEDSGAKTGARSGAKSERAEKPEEKLGDGTGRPASAKADGGKVVEPANEANSVSVDDRPASAQDNGKKVEEPDGKAVMEKVRGMEDPGKVEKTEDAPKEAPSKANEEINPASEKIDDSEKVREEKMKSPPIPSDVPPAESKSPTPSATIAEDKTEKLDVPRAGTPAAANEQLSKTPTKSPEKSPASSPVPGVRDQKADDSRAPPKSPEVTPPSATAKVTGPQNVEEESKVPTELPEQPPPSAPPAKEQKEEPRVELEESKTPSKSPEPAPVSQTKEPNVEVSASKPSEPEKPSENPHHDKAPGATPETRSAVSSVTSPRPEESAEKTQNGAPSPENRESLALPDLVLSPPTSPQGSVKGFDNGERRPLSSRSSSSQSPRSAKSAKSSVELAQSTNGEKKKTTFAEDSGGGRKDEEGVDKGAGETTGKSTSKPPTPTGKRSSAKSEKKSPTKPEVENGNATNESSESNAVPTTNGVADSPTKKSPSKTKDADKRSTAGSPVKSPSKSVKSLPRTPETPSSTAGQEKKKLPMNKIQVGSAPSPNLKTVRSKIGSLENASYKPGGGKVKIENRKLDFSKAQPKIAAKNEKYTPSGGDKKIAQMKLQWNAKPKVGSLENATYRPGGGDKKIETVKLDFKDKAKPKVGSKDNTKHVPGGGAVKSSTTPPKTPQDSSNDIQTQKLDIKAESKIGSMDNMKHKPGGGDKKIFNDKDYLRLSGDSHSGSGSQVETPGENDPSEPVEQTTKDDSPQPPPSTPTKARSLTSPSSSAVTPRAVRSSLAKSPETPGPKRIPTPTVEVPRKEDGSKKEPKVETTESKSPAKDKPSRSPTSPRPPNTLRLKSPEKSSPRRASPKELRLPKLAPSPVAQEATPVNETSHSKITLPKLIEPSSQSTRVAH